MFVTACMFAYSCMNRVRFVCVYVIMCVCVCISVLFIFAYLQKVIKTDRQTDDKERKMVKKDDELCDGKQVGQIETNGRIERSGRLDLSRIHYTAL